MRSTFLLFLFACALSTHGYSQISKQPVLLNANLAAKPKSAALHATITKLPTKGFVLKTTPMAIYGNDPNLKAQRLAKFDALSTQPSITKNINGVNILYKIRKNPDYDNPPAINVQSKSTSTQSNYNCTSYRENVSARSTSFLSVSADGAGIYPGAIYTFTDFYNGSTLRSIGDGKRNPITIYTNNLANSSGDVAVNVTNPSAASIAGSIAPIVRSFSSIAVSATSIGQYTYSDNTASMALNISAGGSYAGFSASGGFQMNKQDKHIYITCDYKIPLYTLSTEIPANGFFTDPAIESTPNLMLISSVMYGTRILANIDIDESSLSDSAFATFKYGDPDATGAQAAFNYFRNDQSKKVTINTYVVGIAPQVALHPSSITEMLQQIDAVIHSINYQSARPISYTLCDMAGNSLGVESATDTYTVTNCVPQSSVYKLSSAKVDIQTGNDNKEDGSDVQVELYNSRGAMVASQHGNTLFPPGRTSSMVLNVTSPDNALLQNFQSGSQNLISIFFTPKPIAFDFDGWDISRVTLTLEFKDQFGTPYPSPVMIDMNNSAVRLVKNKQRLNCYFNGSFQSTTSVQPQ